MQDGIHTALERTYSFDRWNFRNESEFKHELFHQLALCAYKGRSLAMAESGALTPRLHAEAKVENRNPAKADIVLCDPFIFQDFNYKVDHVIELKVSLTTKALNDELQKLDTYQNRTKSVWLVSLNPIRLPEERIPTEHRITDDLQVIGPKPKPQSDRTEVAATKHNGPSLTDVRLTIDKCIDDCLFLYGDGKEQFQSYFWCNFEHEQERRHSFPCEGDFNAHLYHRLRTELPDALRIHSEYTPGSLSRRRIDFLVRAPNEGWSIPIEVKMNWDQFKPKYKNRKLIRSEALTILDRFAAVRDEEEIVSPILVVIQREWRRETKMRNMENAIKDLETTTVPLELVGFDELRNRIVRETFG